MTDTAQAGFAFVQDLATDLNVGDVKVPSFPDILVRIKRTLEDENCDVDRLARVVATEPALAARLLSMANSALLQRGSKKVQDLRTAISRLGHEMLRNSAMTVAVEQIFLSSSLGLQRERLRRVFSESTQVAALSYVLAKNLTQINPDQALLAGLLHNVGKLYILKRAVDHAAFIDTDEALEAIMDSWHGQIGRAIIESWGFSDEMASAAAEHFDLERAPLGPADLVDVVSVAWMMSNPAIDDETASSAKAWSRIRLDDDNRIAIIRESEAEIKGLASVLSG